MVGWLPGAFDLACHGRRGLTKLEGIQEQCEVEAVEWLWKCNRQAGGVMPRGSVIINNIAEKPCDIRQPVS